MRARLALWHTAALAMLLLVFAGSAYALLVRTMMQRTDRYLAETADVFRLELLAERAEAGSDSAEAGADSATATQTLTAFRFRDLSFLLFDAKGHPVVASLAADLPPRAGKDVTPPVPVFMLGRMLYDLAAEDSESRYLTLDDHEGGYRAYALPVRLGTVPYVAATVQSLHAQTDTIELVRIAYLLAIPIALGLSWLGGYAIARRSLAPVAAMSRQAAAISAANLHERLPVANPRDELGALAIVLNALLGRVHDALEQQRRFTADASHELRSPIAVLQSEADVVLSRTDRPADEYRSTVAVMRRAVGRMATIVNDLFLLARADSGEQPLRVVRFYLDELATECVRSLQSVAAARGISMRCTTEPDCEYSGDEELLRRVILNLLDNGIKYSPPGADVVVTLTRDFAKDDPAATVAYRLAVADTGPGIPPVEQDRVFDRFYRVSDARGRDPTPTADQRPPYGRAPDGAGLGLAIARSVVEAHGGKLELARSSAAGSEFVFTLPVVSPR